jgi:hypothetical protein
MFTKGIAVALILTVAFALVFVSPSWTPRTAAAPKPSAVDESADFRGKVLLLRFNSGMETVVLEQVKVRQLGQHAFLVGKAVESMSRGDSLKGKTVWQNVDQIIQIIECQNVEEAKKTLKSLPGAGIGVQFAPFIEAVPAAPGGQPGQPLLIEKKEPPAPGQPLLPGKKKG